MDQEQIIDLLKLIWPLIVIQLALQIYALIDLAKKGKTRNLTPAAWIFIIVFGEILGSIIYFVIGRSEE